MSKIADRLAEVSPDTGSIAIGAACGELEVIAKYLCLDRTAWVIQEVKPCLLSRRCGCVLGVFRSAEPEVDLVSKQRDVVERLPGVGRCLDSVIASAEHPSPIAGPPGHHYFA